MRNSIARIKLGFVLGASVALMPVAVCAVATAVTVIAGGVVLAGFAMEARP